MAVTRFKERAERWNTGEVFYVNGLGTDFNKHQYWLREVLSFLLPSPCCHHHLSLSLPLSPCVPLSLSLFSRCFGVNNYPCVSAWTLAPIPAALALGVI